MGTRFGSYTGAVAGAIVQCVGPGGERRTIVAQGNPVGRGAMGDESLLGSLRRACVTIDGWPGEWRVEVISTPETIYRDLQGSRMRDGQDELGRFGSSGLSEETLALPEVILLGCIGRMDLLAR